MNNRFLAFAFLAGALIAPPTVRAQTVAAPASEEYDRSGLWRMFFGQTWREVWSEPIKAPVLDLATFAGGLKAFEAGGNQSRTLRLRGQDGRVYMFRSVNKDVQRRALPEDLRHTPAGAIIQDQTSAMYPSAPVAISVLQDALGLLHAPTQLYFLPDDARLGEWREDYRNQLGFIEERPEDAEDGSVPFAGADKVQATEKVLENLEESLEDRFESRDYLTARLLDFIIGDTDRGADQWRFAKFERGARDVVRPIPRDRDYAFMNANGFIPRVAAIVYPKLTHYSTKMPHLKTLVFMTREFDRSHLVDISRAQWDSTVAFVQQRLTNDVIDRAIARLPEPHLRLSREQLRDGLRQRRDDLESIAAEYYLMVNEDADIFASDEDERAEIDRNADGSVRVRLWDEDAKPGDAPVFDRRFVPTETDEIRVYMERGNDYAVVRGTAERSIELRVVGGEGDDVLVDSSRVAHGDATHFYDALGKTTLVSGANTSFSDKPFVTAPPKCALGDEECDEEKTPRVLMEERRGRQQDLMNSAGDFFAQKTKLETTRSWGKTSSWGAIIEYDESDGVVLGVGPTTTDFGFRRNPYEWQTIVTGMVAPLAFDFGARFQATRHFVDSPWSVGLYAHATQTVSNRFFGYGNNTPLISRSRSIVPYQEALLRPQIRYEAGSHTHFAFGPEARYLRNDRHWDGTRNLEGETESFGQVGANLEMIADFATRTPLQQRGLTLQLDGSAFPKAWDVDEAYARATGVARMYVPLGSATVAVRAGGQKVWGDSVPLHDAALIGGISTLRGYWWNRFAGDAAAFGSAELRLPLFRMTLLTRGTLGAIGLADAGRVWMDGVSEGNWHTSYGGGLWFGSLGQAVSATYAHGEEGRFYINYGLPF